MISTLRAKCESREPAQRQATWFWRTGQPGAKAQLYNRFPAPAAPGTSLLQVLQSKRRNCQLSSSSSSYHCFAQPPLLPRRLSVYQCFGPSRCVPQELSFSQCFPPARGFPKDSAHINVLRSRVLRSRPRPPKELSFYQCFGPQSLHPTRTHLLSLFWPAVTASHENSAFITVLARSLHPTRTH